MANKILRFIKVNEETGQTEILFPMPVENPEVNQEFLNNQRELGYEVLHWGRECFILVPCKCHITDRCGRTVYVETSEEEQQKRFNDYSREIKAELNRKRHDGRCSFFNEKGMRWRCPLNKPNPDYDPNGPEDPKKNPKTIYNSCTGCEFERFKQAHDMTPLSAYESDDENGKEITHEFVSPEIYPEYNRLRYLVDRAKCILQKHEGKHKMELDIILDLLVAGFKQVEIANQLEEAPATINYRVHKLRNLFQNLPELQQLIQHI